MVTDPSSFRGAGELQRKTRSVSFGDVCPRNIEKKKHAVVEPTPASASRRKRSQSKGLGREDKGKAARGEIHLKAVQAAL